MGGSKEVPDRYQEPSRGVSGIREARGDDGKVFGILQGASDEAAIARGSALSNMRKLVAQREPDLLTSLQTRSGISAEYAMSAAIRDAQDPGVKGDLVRISIDEHLAEGHRRGAVNKLKYANAAELDLPEYGIDFVREMYDESMTDNPFDAWMIAQQMLSYRDKMIRPSPHETIESQTKTIQEWTQRESSAFALHATNILDQAEQAKESGMDYARGMSDEESRVRFGIETIFNTMEFRNIDGFANGGPQSDLARRAVEAMVNLDIARGVPGWALKDAQKANMSDDYIDQLQKRVSPPVKERITDRVRKIGKQIKRAVHPPRNTK